MLTAEQNLVSRLLIHEKRVALAMDECIGSNEEWSLGYSSGLQSCKFYIEDMLELYNYDKSKECRHKNNVDLSGTYYKYMESQVWGDEV